jgi:hypothetical protein
MLRSTISTAMLLAALVVLAWARDGDAANIRHYDLDIRPDFDLKAIRTRATLTIDNPALEDSFWFELSPRYTGLMVRDGASPARFERSGGRVLVVVDHPRVVQEMTFEISGRPGRSDDEDREVVGARDVFLLWSDRFYPVVFTDWATVRTTITLPEGFQAIAPGRLVASRVGPETATYQFETTRPTRAFSVFADSRWIRSERVIGGLRFVTLLFPESERHRDRILSSAADVVSFYRDLHGVTPFDEYAFVTLDSIYARRAFPGFVGYGSRYLDLEMSRTGFDAHETALLWWGYTLGGQGPGAFQWTEGFGDYMEVLYEEARGKPLSANLTRAREAYLATAPGEDVPYGDLRGSTPQKIVHGKYPWLLHVLRYAIGDATFRRGIRLLFDRYRFRTFSMGEFIATFEEAAGRPLTWWREEWLERPGPLDLVISYEVRRAAGKYSIRGIVAQPRDVRKIPLEIDVVTRQGSRVHRVPLSTRETAFTLLSKEKPVRIVADPNRWLPANIKVVADSGAAQR